MLHQTEYIYPVGKIKKRLHLLLISRTARIEGLVALCAKSAVRVRLWTVADCARFSKWLSFSNGALPARSTFKSVEMDVWLRTDRMRSTGDSSDDANTVDMVHIRINSKFFESLLRKNQAGGNDAKT